MRFDIITLFPGPCEKYSEESIIGRAARKGILDIHVHDLRKHADTSSGRVDDRPYGGGPGMVLQPGPVIRAVEAVKKEGKKRVKTVLLSAAGRAFDDALAKRFARNYDQIILIAGHYEGVDERVRKIVRPEEISVGPYVLTGGELPALIIMDAVSRKLPGVLGKEESLEEGRLGVGVPAYTRPEVFIHKGKRYRVPAVLRSGNHKDIEAWRLEHKKE